MSQNKMVAKAEAKSAPRGIFEHTKELTDDGLTKPIRTRKKLNKKKLVEAFSGRLCVDDKSGGFIYDVSGGLYVDAACLRVLADELDAVNRRARFRGRLCGQADTN